MPKQYYTASEAAAALGISLDTLRRWDKAGRVRVERDSSNRRIVPAEEIERLRGDGEGAHISARNRFKAIVTEVKVEGLMAQVEMVVSEPVLLAVPSSQLIMYVHGPLSGSVKCACSVIEALPFAYVWPNGGASM